jgi:hypothetical protein
MLPGMLITAAELSLALVLMTTLPEPLPGLMLPSAAML